MSVSQPFHVQLYCAVAEVGLVSNNMVFEHGGELLQQTEPPRKPGFFRHSFEQFMDITTAWSGVYAEGDGSWSWVAGEKNARREPLWKVEGMIYDRADRIFYVELQGQIDNTAWPKLIEALGVWHEDRILICLTKQGVWVEAESFASWLGKPCGGPDSTVR